MFVHSQSIDKEALGTIKSRLAWAMLLRVVLISALLGATLALNYDGMVSFQSTSPRFLLGLIAFTYLATIVYGIWYRSQRKLRLLAYVQFLVDSVLCGALAYATGGIASGFTFLFHLWVIIAAVVMGGRSPFIIAGSSAFVLGLLTVLMRGKILPVLSDQLESTVTITGTLYFLFVNIASLFLVATLVTSLVRRLEKTGRGLEAERAHREEVQALHSDVVRSLTVGLVTTDIDGCILDMNPEGMTLLGITSDDIRGEVLSRWLPDFGVMLGLGVSVNRGHGMARCSDGTELPIEFSVNPLLAAEGQKTGSVVSFNDLSKVRKLEEELEQARQLAALGELAASLAHEIRNPLSAVSGSFQMLSSHPTFGDDERSLSRIIQLEIERIERLVNDLLDYARPREPERLTKDVAPIIEDVVNAFLLGKDDEDLCVDFSFTPPVHAPVDENQIKQILWNLLRNAAQAVGEKGRIRLTAKIIDGSRESLQIDVEDNGPGVPKDVQTKVFNPFYSTRERGMGLGLAICERIAKGHRGRIEVFDSELGGALFRVSLPI